jgi:hypothetical protein
MNSNNRIKKLYELVGNLPVYLSQSSAANVVVLSAEIDEVKLSCVVKISDYENVITTVWEEEYDNEENLYHVESDPMPIRKALGKLNGSTPYTLPIPFSAWGIEN